MQDDSFDSAVIKVIMKVNQLESELTRAERNMFIAKIDRYARARDLTSLQELYIKLDQL